VEVIIAQLLTTAWHTSTEERRLATIIETGANHEIDFTNKPLML
jgi:hypothetical protein